VTDLNDKKEPFIKRALDFLGDRGFYIVLFLCVAVIGVTAWILSSNIRKPGVISEETLSTKVTTPPLSTETEDITEATLPPVTAAPTITEDFFMDEVPTLKEEDNDEPFMSQERAAPEATPESSDSVQTIAPMATDFMWPVSGSVERAYSVEALSYDKTMADWRTHPGVDISAALGAKVVSVANGVVEAVYNHEMMGTTVVINHGGGLRSIYCNLAATPTVAPQDVVNMGDVIGAVGETALAEIGDVTHLHFQMTYNGKSLSPSNYLPGF
jgi:murein DD-endopeptidase MepM/ murein hydrolase activator NlpD